MTRRLAAFLGVAAVCVQAVSAESVARITALASGELLLDGRPVTLAALDAALTNLRASQGVVWYYREHPDQEPAAEALEVIDLVVKHGLPIRMSSKADFSDVVDVDVDSRPEKR